MKRLRIFVGLAAAVGLCVLAYRIGLSRIAAQAGSLRVVLPVVVAAGLLRLLIQTRAWRVALSAEGLHVPQSRLVAVRLASQAAGYLTALGPLVSELAKLVFLRSHAGASATAPATLVETGSYWFTSVILGLAGACAAMFLIGDKAVGGVAAAVFGVALALLGTRRSMLSPLVRTLGPRAPVWLRSAETVEHRIRCFRDRKPHTARQVLGLESVAQLLTVTEVAVALWAMGLHPSLLQVVVIEAAGRMIKIVAAWIPGRIGADEGGAAASFALLGLPPAAGLMLALARRLRDLLWCAAGFAWAVDSNARQRIPEPPAVAPIPRGVVTCRS